MGYHRAILDHHPHRDGHGQARFDASVPYSRSLHFSDRAVQDKNGVACNLENATHPPTHPPDNI